MQYSKTERQNAIREVILKQKIESQGDLKAALKDNGIEISQATLSRDLQEMGVIKNHGSSVSFYSIPEGRFGMDGSITSVLGIEISGNIAVVKTLPGHASMLASLMDRKQLPEIAGTIAGDDTIFIVLRSGVTAERGYKVISTSLPGTAR